MSAQPDARWLSASRINPVFAGIFHDKLVTAEVALRDVRSGDHVYVHPGCATPERLLDALVEIHLGNLERFLKAVGPHIDIILFGDDLGMRRVRQARGALAAVNQRVPGFLAVSLASLEPLRSGAVMVLEFRGRAAQTGASVRVANAVVGEN
jgi:hypothetical protein